MWHYHTKSSNFVPTLNPSLRQEIGFIAMGETVNQDMKFYSSLHEGADTKKLAEIHSKYSNDTSDFTGSSWDLIRAGALDENESKNDMKPYSLVLSTKNELLERINNTPELLKKIWILMIHN